MAERYKVLIESEGGDKIYPHTFADVVKLSDGTDVETSIEALKAQIGGITSDWGSITGKPNTFPPSVHTHTKANITDFAHTHTKAEVPHTHTASEVSGISYPVTSVAGKTGAVALTKADVGLGNVQNYGVSNSVTSASNTTIATSGAVKTAMDKANQAFQYANNGKTLIANAITGKGVPASGNDTHQVLANKVGQIKSFNEQSREKFMDIILSTTNPMHYDVLQSHRIMSRTRDTGGNLSTFTILGSSCVYIVLGERDYGKHFIVKKGTATFHATVLGWNNLEDKVYKLSKDASCTYYTSRYWYVTPANLANVDALLFK